MKPQPPVTRMRIVARTSSGHEIAPADFPAWSQQRREWRASLFAMDWRPWLIIGLGALLRFLLLSMKPPHFDEGINGWFVDQMTKTGYYRYDPTNYHGPLHFYVLFLFQTLLGRSIFALRLPVVLVSIACIYLALKFERFFERRIAWLGALAMAVSPGFVFYGRYSIHEVWLQFFSMLFIFGLLGLWKNGTAKDLWSVGLGLAGMILTKETYILHMACAFLAIPAFFILQKLKPGDETECAPQTWTRVDLIMVTATGLGLLVLFYSGTFFHWSGLKGLYETFAAWLLTGENGNGHQKPYYYWLELMLRYELPVLLGLTYCLCAWWIRNINLRFIAIYAVGTLVAYSIVRYKTPWCMISFAWPFLFLFGAGIFSIPRVATTLRKAIATLVLCASLGSCIWLNYFRCTTDTEQYVYVQTYNDIFKLTEPVLTLAHKNPIYYQMTGHMIRTSAYPLPWMLADFPHVGYYENNTLPQKMDADFLLVQEDRVEAVEKQLHGDYFTEPLTIRSYQDTSKLYLNVHTFQRFFPDRPPDVVHSKLVR